MQSEKGEAAQFCLRGGTRLCKCWNLNCQKSYKMLSLLFIVYCLWNGAEQNKYHLWINKIFLNFHFVPLERTFILKYWNLICYTFHWVWWTEFDFESSVIGKKSWYGCILSLNNCKRNFLPLKCDTAFSTILVF